MSLLKTLMSHLKQNAAEYYTLLIIVVAVPVAVGMIVGYKWGILLSFASQALIGVLYIRGKK